MPKLRNMLGETGTVEIPVPDDEPLVVTYRRASLTPRMQARLVELQRADGPDGQPGPEAIAVYCDVFSKAIASWNLTDDEGRPIGTDAESLADVDFAVLNLVMDAIGREVRPDPLSGGGSSNGSSATAGSAPRPIGTAS